MRMIDGVDAHCDAMGMVPCGEVMCGECKARMKETSPKRYRCPRCGAEFEDR